MKFLKFWFPVLLYSGIIFYVSGLPNVKTPAPWPLFDKFLHILEYAVLGFLFARALFHSAPGAYSQHKIILTTLIFCLFYGVSDEVHQLFVIGRDASLFDVLADGLGGLLGGVLFKS
ncbi:MAG: VanZ family protein [Candidatus Omnitrophota bacterium]